MGIMNLFSTKKRRELKFARMLNGYSPVFSQFGDSIYASDVVQMCIDIIATECSKLQPKHIRVDKNEMQKNVEGSLNRLFKFAPNPMMSTRDFIEKTIWSLYMNYNAFIYPEFKILNNKRYFTALYPLNPTCVSFLQDSSDELFIEMQFGNGEKYTLPYSRVIHLRKKYSVNEVMGGGYDGQPNNVSLLKVLQINDTVLQGVEKGVISSLTIRGLLKINTMLDEGKQQIEIEKFEKSILNSKSGILPTDLKSDYVPLKVEPKIIDKDTMEFLQNKVLNWYGVSVPILTGDFTDEQYQAFYEKTLEPIIISLGQAFSCALFTASELDHGNEIVFYPQKLLFTNTKNKIAVADILGNRGALKNNELLDLFGYPPYEGGDERYMSLNYVDVNIANQYQLNKAKTEVNSNGKKSTE